MSEYWVFRDGTDTNFGELAMRVDSDIAGTVADLMATRSEPASTIPLKIGINALRSTRTVRENSSMCETYLQTACCVTAGSSQQ